MCIQQDEERFVVNRFTFEVQDIAGVAAKQHSEAAHERRSPLLLAHFVSAGIKPHHILDFGSSYPSSL